jgi:hypothetical protein
MIKPREQGQEDGHEQRAPLRAPGSPVDRPECSAAAEVTVRCSSEPPSLLPGAASALLGILRAVAESDTRCATERERAA